MSTQRDRLNPHGLTPQERHERAKVQRATVAEMERYDEESRVSIEEMDKYVTHAIETRDEKQIRMYLLMMREVLGNPNGRVRWPEEYEASKGFLRRLEEALKEVTRHE
jgi:hypothetical protein